MRRAPALLVAAGLFVLLAMPGRLAQGADPLAATDGDSELGFDNVDVIDHGLEAKLNVVSAGSQRTANNLLAIFATVKNLTAHRLVIQAQTLYKDRAGNWLDGGRAGWITLTLQPHQKLDYRSASLSIQAQDFVVRIRRP
jgi:hypothetical protein